MNYYLTSEKTGKISAPNARLPYYLKFRINFYNSWSCFIWALHGFVSGFSLIFATFGNYWNQKFFVSIRLNLGNKLFSSLSQMLCNKYFQKTLYTHEVKRWICYGFLIKSNSRPAINIRVYMSTEVTYLKSTWPRIKKYVDFRISKERKHMEKY